MTGNTTQLEAEPDRKKRFLDLLETHRKIVFKVTNTYCRKLQDQDELSQEIISHLWRAFPSFDPSRSFSTWMYRIALNVAISFLRSQTRWRMVSLDSEKHDLAESRGNEPEKEETIRELYQFIDQLDPLHRGLLMLYLEEHSYREIAEILGITETNVATKINRLKARMSQELAPTFSERGVN